MTTKQRLYIDAYSSFGRTNFKESSIPYKAEELLDEMEYARIHASVVSSSVARDYAFTKGNRDVTECIKKNKRLYGIATVIPDLSFELEEGFSYIDRCLDEGIRGLKLYPNRMNHGFDPFIMEKLAMYMMEKEIPLVVEQEDISWQSLREVLEAFPKLKILLCNSSWAYNRWLLPLAERFDSLYFEISANQANDLLAICKKQIGLDRILFGSNYPRRIMGGIKAMVEYADISEEDKDKVAYINAATLFNIPVDRLESYDESSCWQDEIAKCVDLGKPLDFIPVIDAHAHMVDEQDQTVSLVPMLHGDMHHIVKKMDRLGIDRIITSPWEGIKTAGDDANETSLLAMQQYPHRFYAYATYNPNYPEDLESVISVFYEKHRFIGIKPYVPSHGIDLTDEKYATWFEYGNKNRLIMLVHCGSFDIPLKVLDLSEKYEYMTFILAHSGMSYKMAEKNMETVKKRDHVYLEITQTNMTNGIIEAMVQEIGSKKVLFGTDLPMRDPAPQLAWVTYSKISVEEKKDILGRNIQRIINRTYRQGAE
jgi:predicted TIM-barrel fold metal-dependent hydrolase